MALLRIKNLSIAFGIHRLLDEASLIIKRGERIGLLGRNGEGKSTLLKIINSEIPYDEGELQGMDAIKIAKLDQAPSLLGPESVYQLVASGLGDIGHTIARYHQLSLSGTVEALSEMSELQTRIEAEHAWPLMNNIEKTISRLGLVADDAVADLSGGWKRRVSLARALVIEPDLLLLDEPTNHLDIEAIDWLEKQLLQFKGAILFVTHDRAFLEKIATQIVDLDRGQLVAWPGRYSDYLRRKAASLEEESRQNAVFDKKLAQEEKWIRQGIKARRTRNEGRVRALKKMRTERAERRNRQGNANLMVADEARSGKRIIEAKNISFSFENNLIISDFSTIIQRQDRIGIIGPNGAGKTTLINLLLGKLSPDSGEMKLGTNIEVAYFDQLRGQLDPEKTIVEFIGEGRDEITISGRSRHVISYLNDFLFTPARARSPIKSLSGGERARVLLAWLFSKPVNFLVMDEPTNDLDIETLELLEEVLLEFKGTLLLVSHDRTFMDNVITSSLVLDGKGNVAEYVGGYTESMQQMRNTSTKLAAPLATSEKQPVKTTLVAQATKKKLAYKEQRELETIPDQLDALEAKQSELTDALSAPNLYQDHPQKARELNDSLQQVSARIDQLMERWAELEG
ncbi:MAG: ATP-binding cassette domain-containing protein [Proteobacteria bacterium]|nr:ATP-binding cassette domain-containing protein [Pseudomonadota bacterium]